MILITLLSKTICIVKGDLIRFIEFCTIKVFLRKIIGYFYTSEMMADYKKNKKNKKKRT